MTSAKSQGGFSILEVLGASTILTVGIVALAQLVAISTKANGSSHATTFAAVLAGQKMEQLRGLTWGFDLVGVPVSDTTTNTAVVPAAPANGTGLSPSPAGTLRGNVAGYVDYLDANGNSLGGGATPPSGTIYCRRWSVEPLPTNPNNTLVLQALVTRRQNRSAEERADAGRAADDVRLVSVKTRKAG